MRFYDTGLAIINDAFFMIENRPENKSDTKEKEDTRINRTSSL
jgi:hypothetical protein